jgi:hypothetical protein
MYAGLRLPVAEVAARLGRSDDAVVSRRRALGIPPRRAPLPWSPKEDALLKLAASQGVPATALAKYLGRSIWQVRGRQRAVIGLGPSPRPYTPQEDDLLRAYLARGEGLSALSRELDRSVDALRLHAQRLGVYQPKPRRSWSDWEDAAIRDGYTAAMPCTEIARELPLRTPQSVAARARTIGLTTYARRWTARDDQRLRAIGVNGIPIEQAALQLGRTPEALRIRAGRLGTIPPIPLVSPRSGLRWTVEDDDLLRLHKALNPARLAQLLGRSDAAVCRRLCALGLRSRAQRSPHHPAPEARSGSPGVRRQPPRDSSSRRTTQGSSHRARLTPEKISAADSIGRMRSAGDAERSARSGPS